MMYAKIMTMREKRITERKGVNDIEELLYIFVDPLNLFIFVSIVFETVSHLMLFLIRVSGRRRLYRYGFELFTSHRFYRFR